MSISRREFATVVAAAATGLPLATTSLADEPKKPDDEKPDPLRTEMVLWLESIRTRYPNERLTPEIMTLIAGDVLGDIMHCRRVSSFALKNSDAPAFAMSVWRAADK